MATTLGQIAYEAYCGQSNYKSLVSGAPLPRWDMQPDTIKAAWEQAGRAIRFHVLQTLPTPGKEKKL